MSIMKDMTCEFSPGYLLFKGESFNGAVVNDLRAYLAAQKKRQQGCQLLECHVLWRCANG